MKDKLLDSRRKDLVMIMSFGGIGSAVGTFVCPFMYKRVL